jgi:hypothetical protein
VSVAGERFAAGPANRGEAEAAGPIEADVEAGEVHAGLR